MLVTRLWNEAEFAASRDTWDALVESSAADPLFLSWDWQWRWWRHHAPLLGATLCVVAVYAGERLIGLAPFYRHRTLVRGLLPVRRLELIGTAWRHPTAAFSAYLDVIAASDMRETVGEAIGAWLVADRSWDDLVLCCTKREGLAAALAQIALGRAALVREVDTLQAWRARLSGRFDGYVARLSSGVRRKLMHQRTKLANPRLEWAQEGDIGEYLSTLRRYVAQRWQSDQGRANAPAQQFQLDFAGQMARAGSLRLSRLTAGGAVLSVMYNVRMGGTIYYLQSGFDPISSQGVSPGYLHFGYAIEAAWAEGADYFDLLAGPGRYRDYKRDLLTDPVPVVTYHAVRGPVARALYGAYRVLGRDKSARIT